MVVSTTLMRRWAVRAGAVGVPEGDGGAEAGVPRLRPADRRPRRVHARRHAGLRRRRPHHRRRHRARAQEHRRARPDHLLGACVQYADCARMHLITMDIGCSDPFAPTQSY